MNIIKIAGKREHVLDQLIKLGIVESSKYSTGIDPLLMADHLIIERSIFQNFRCVFVNLDNKKYFSSSVEMSFEEFKEHEHNLKDDITTKIEDYTILSIFSEDEYYETINGDRIPRKALEEFVDKYSKIGIKGEYRHPKFNDMSRFCTIKDDVINMNNIRFVGTELKCDLTFLDKKVYKEYEPYLNKKWEILGCRFLINQDDPSASIVVTFDLLDIVAMERRNNYLLLS